MNRVSRRAEIALGSCVTCALLVGYGLMVNPMVGLFTGVLRSTEADPWQDAYAASECTMPLSPGGAASTSWPDEIPPLLHFVFKSFAAKHRHLENEERTAALFEGEVGVNGRVYLWDDARCSVAVRCVGGHGLAGRFARETRGPLKADLCRYAVLRLHGGLYVDSDLEFLRDPGAPLRPSDTLVAPIEAGRQKGHRSGIFQSYIAAAPGHPVLQQVLKELNHAPAWVSTDSNRLMLFEAMENSPDARMFYESVLPTNHPLYHDPRNFTALCNYVISEDNALPIRVTTRPYAFSHVVGSRNCRAL